MKKRLSQAWAALRQERGFDDFRIYAGFRFTPSSYARHLPTARVRDKPPRLISKSGRSSDRRFRLAAPRRAGYAHALNLWRVCELLVELDD